MVFLFLALCGNLAGNEIHLLGDVDLVQKQVAGFALYFGRECRIGNLRIKDGGVHSVVLEIHGALSVGSGVEYNSLCFNLLWLSEQCHHWVDGINADVHHGSVGKLRFESVQDNTFLELVVTGRVLAIAGKIATDGSQIL